MHRIVIFLMIFFMSLTWGAPARAEEYDYGRQKLVEALPSEVASALEDNGITPDNGGAAKLTLGGVLKYLLTLAQEQIRAPLKLLVSLCAVILLCTLTSSAADIAQESLSGTFAAVGVLAGAVLSAAAVSEVLKETLELLSSAALFITAFIPIFAGVLTVMGRAAAASAVNMVTLAATQLFSQLAVNFLAPLCGAVMGLSIAGAVHPQFNLARLGELVRKGVVWTLGLLMTVFMSLLSVQTLAASPADSVLIRTAKFAVSSGVPIVGGTISDAVATVHGSLGLIKGAVGSYGLIAAAVMILPTLVNLTGYRCAIAVAEALSDTFGQKELTSLLKSCGAVMSIISAVVACFLLLNTIAAVIMLSLGGAA